MSDTDNPFSSWSINEFGHGAVDQASFRRQVIPNLLVILRRSLRTQARTALAIWVKAEAARLAREAGIAPGEDRDLMVHPIASKLCDALLDLLQRGGPETQLLRDTLAIQGGTLPP